MNKNLGLRHRLQESQLTAQILERKLRPLRGQYDTMRRMLAMANRTDKTVSVTHNCERERKKLMSLAMLTMNVEHVDSR